ncbi:MAG: hypothetical protein VZQ84_05495 [Anaerovoracaceae bacterium]|nr:hypothetical protein [Anaerovoracaceae bacterium]
MRKVSELPGEIGVSEALPLDGCAVRLSEKNRVNILALGNVGVTVLLGLRLLGGDVISEIGICDIDEKNARRVEIEMEQTAYPFYEERMPSVHVTAKEDLFDCDVFVFCASAGVPPVGYEKAADIRMAQFEANRKIIDEYAKMAEDAGYGGMVCVMSDPVDNLCAAFMDSSGLFPWQIQGLGLGVMNARAIYFARRDDRFRSYIHDGRVYGPHGEDLVAANSVSRYDDALSVELAKLASNANLEVRDLGYKPYIGPGISSGALTIIQMLRGKWHYGSVYLGDAERGAFLGIKNRVTERGIEYEDIPLDNLLYARIEQSYLNLCEAR